MIRFLKRWFAGAKDADGEDLLSKCERAPFRAMWPSSWTETDGGPKKRGICPGWPATGNGMNTGPGDYPGRRRTGHRNFDTIFFFHGKLEAAPGRSRLPDEVAQEFLHTDLEELVRRNVQVRMMGEETHLPDHTRPAIRQFQEATRNNTGLILNFALNYGSREEMLRAFAGS